MHTGSYRTSSGQFLGLDTLARRCWTFYSLCFPLSCRRSWLFSVVTVLSFLLTACEEKKQAKKVQPYNGPIEEINDVRLLYSEAAVLRVKLTTPKQFRYENDDRRYPKPVNIVFYSATGEEETTLQSDSGRYNKAKDLYTVMGHVVVIKKLSNQKMLTTLLNWSPVSKKVFTDKPVTILSPETGERLQGVGLDAPQDFSRYSIRKTTGIFNIEGGQGF